VYQFDEVAAPGLDSGPLGNHAGLLDPNKHTVVDDPEPDLAKSRCKVMLFKRDSEVGYTGQPFRVGNPITSGATEYTVAFWWKGSDTSGFWTFMGTGTGGAWNARFVYYVGGTTMHVNSGNSNDLNMAAPGFTTNEWHHYAFALSIPLQTMYTWRDGVPTSQANGTSPASVVGLSKVFINALEFNGTLLPNGGAVGYFDNYRVYNRVLDLTDVLTIYGEEKRP